MEHEKKVDPVVRIEFERVKNIILRNENKISLNELFSKGDWSRSLFDELIKVMFENGELYEPTEGVLAVAWFDGDDRKSIPFAPLLEIEGPRYELLGVVQ